MRCSRTLVICPPDPSGAATFLLSPSLETRPREKSFPTFRDDFTAFRVNSTAGRGAIRFIPQDLCAGVGKEARTYRDHRHLDKRSFAFDRLTRMRTLPRLAGAGLLPHKRFHERASFANPSRRQAGFGGVYVYDYKFRRLARAL